MLALLLAFLLALGPAPAAADDPLPAAAAVDAAIDQGVAWLLGEQRADGTWGSGSRAFGHTALAAYALLHAGLEPDDKGFAKALRWLDRHGPALKRTPDKEADTYSTALLVLLLRDRGLAGEPRMGRAVAVLAKSQAANGQWSYAPKAGRKGHDAGDNSNTQVAVLALGAAVGAGLPVDEATLQRAWAWWRGSAQADGGFGYASGGSKASASIGSMTAAGVASIAILESALSGRATDTREEDAPTSRLLERALALLAAGFEVDKNFGPAQGAAGDRQRNAGRGWVHYFLWSVERALVLAGRERLGERDWYAAGAAHLLASQKQDGSWRGEHPLYATCFALLFLTRAADPPRAFTPPDRPLGPVTGDELPPAEAPPAPRLPVGDVADWLARGLPPAELVAACLLLGRRGLLDLVAALAARDGPVRQRANEALRTLLSASAAPTRTPWPAAVSRSGSGRTSASSSRSTGGLSRGRRRGGRLRTRDRARPRNRPIRQAWRERAPEAPDGEAEVATAGGAE